MRRGDFRGCLQRDMASQHRHCHSFTPHTVCDLWAHTPFVPWWHVSVLHTSRQYSWLHTHLLLCKSGADKPPRWLVHTNCFHSVAWMAAVLFFFSSIWQVKSVKLVSSCRHCLAMEMNVETFIFVRNYVKLFKFIGELQQTSQLMNISVICFWENTYGSEKITLQGAFPFWSKDVWKEDGACHSR